MATTLVIKSPNVSTLTNLSKNVRDGLLATDTSHGVKFLMRLGSPLSYSGVSPVVDQTPVLDISLTADAKFNVTSGQTLNFVGNGADFTSLTAKGASIEIPANAASAIYNNSQYYLVCFYVKLPVSGDWNSNAYVPIFCWNKTTNGWAGGVDMVTCGMSTNTGVKQLLFWRQTASGAAESVGAFSPVPSDFFGAICQISMWRNAAGQGVRVRTPTSVNNLTKVVGSNNSADFSGQTGVLGVGPAIWPAAAWSGGYLTAHNFKIYSGFVEALGISGRDPSTVVDGDYARLPLRPPLS